MAMLNLQENSLWLNFGLFAVAAAAIWWAGSKLERHANAIANKTGWGKAFLGLVLLAAATSLPEIATTTTASLRGEPSMAVHNLLGGVIMQTAVLALVDLVMGPRALSHVSPRFASLMQGVGLVFLLSVVLAGIPLAGRFADSDSWIGHLAITTWLVVLLLSYFLILYFAFQAEKRPRWQPIAQDERTEATAKGSDRPIERRTLKQLALYFAWVSLVVLAAGWAVARTGEALAEQTGLGTNFVGATLVAISTSLPEISTTISAARNRNYDMAFGNIFGSNAFDVTLLALVGALAGSGAMTATNSASAQFAAGLGILVTCVYLWGLLERQDRTILRVGWDSAAVLVMTIGGTGVMYWLR
jgi:cation:H+ antiporter